MNAISRLVHFVSLVFAGLFAFQGPAAALTSQSAAMCKPYGASNAGGLTVQTNGIFNYSGSAQYVTCPVVRVGPTKPSIFQVMVDGNVPFGTIYCWIYSYDYNGAFLGAGSFSATGVFYEALNLTPAQVPYFSYQTVICSVPNNGGIFDIKPEPQ